MRDVSGTAVWISDEAMFLGVSLTDSMLLGIHKIELFNNTLLMCGELKQVSAFQGASRRKRLLEGRDSRVFGGMVARGGLAEQVLPERVLLLLYR